MRDLILLSLQNLIKEPDVATAYGLLDEWGTRAEDPLYKAACHYLIHYVIPTLNGIDCHARPLPLWVDRLLFHPPVSEVLNVSTWLSLFPGTSCEGLYERVNGFGGYFGTDIQDEVINRLKEENIGLYFSPNGNNGKRNIENTDRLNACFADFDEGTKESQLALIRSLPLTPSIIVESGRGYHVYWLFTAPERDKVLWRRIQKKIIAVCGSDPKICNPDRLMRLPFSWHTKTDDKKLVKIVEYSQRRYSMNDVEIAFPPEPERQYTGPSAKPRGLKVPELAHLSPNHRHGTLLEETGRIYANLPIEKAADARAAMKYWYFHSSNPPKTYWESETDDICDDIEKKEYGRVVSR
jgi:hypothetical protein